MSGKKLINGPGSAVDECLEGLVATHPGLTLLQDHRVVVRSDLPTDAVTLISGGGAGHEPAHAGYVGAGMLSGAVSGAVFTSPPPASILAAIKAVSNEKGTLLIIKNYTGDRLNFGIAAERAKAGGLKVDMVVVGEDCALTSADKTAGRRGLAGTVFIHKMAGAMAAEGQSLESITAFCKQAAQSMGTMSVSLSACSVPGSLGPSFTLPPDEMELGLGIHGEAGVRRTKLVSAKEAVDAMLCHMTKKGSVTRFNIQDGDDVALMVNNLGGTSVLELNIIAKEAIQWIERCGARVSRAYVGAYMTSLEMAGVSLTVMALNDDRKKYLDAPAHAPGWHAPIYPLGERDRVTPGKKAAPDVSSTTGSTATSTATDAATLDEGGAEVLTRAVAAACEVLVGSETELNRLDTEAGDGDCGTTHTRGATAILGALGAGRLVSSCPSRLLLDLASLVEQEMGGSSGAIYSVFLSAAAGPLQRDTGPRGWCDGLGAGMRAVMKYGGADPGDRTMVDAFHGAHEALCKALDAGSPPIQALQQAAQGACAGAVGTAGMAARAGRASYVAGARVTGEDPGARAVALWLGAVSEACGGSS